MTKWDTVNCLLSLLEIKSIVVLKCLHCFCACMSYLYLIYMHLLSPPCGGSTSSNQAALLLVTHFSYFNIPTGNYRPVLLAFFSLAFWIEQHLSKSQQHIHHTNMKMLFCHCLQSSLILVKMLYNSSLAKYFLGGWGYILFSTIFLFWRLPVIIHFFFLSLPKPQFHTTMSAQAYGHNDRPLFYKN